MKGKIVRLIPEKGFGFIYGDDKVERFFHKSGLKNVTFEELTRGREVTFEEGEGEKGPRAEEIYV